MLAILNRMLAGDADVPVMSPDSAQDLWRLAQANRVTPALARCIQSDPESAWPDELRTKACEATAFSRFRNILLMALLNRIAKAFNEAGIDWIALKGPVFTAQYYGDLSARVSGDLDVLVLPAAVPAAVKALTALGILPTRPVQHQTRRFGVLPHEFKFYSPSPRFLVELHSSLSSACYEGVPVETVFARRQSFSLEGTAYPVMSPEDTLLFACLHGFGHRWEHLTLTYSVDRVLRCTAPKGLDWDYITHRMQASRKQRAVLLALALSRRCFESPLPDSILRRGEADRSLPRLQAEVFDRMGKPRSQVPSRSILHFKWRVLESPADRLGLLGRTCARCADALSRHRQADRPRR